MTENNIPFRHELKYPVSYADYLSISRRLKTVMKTDPHTGEDGRYLVQSVYFDNFRNKALREKADGLAVREKFRIRYYNNDMTFLTLEKKMKYDQLCAKYSEKISLPMYEAITGGRRFSPPSGSLAEELRIKMNTQLLRPKVLVSYTREPYIYGTGNVRVTFDHDIRTAPVSKISEDDIPGISVCDGIIIMEVKYDSFIPDIITGLLQAPGIRQQSFSKYCICRKFG